MTFNSDHPARAVHPAPKGDGTEAFLTRLTKAGWHWSRPTSLATLEWDLSALNRAGDPPELEYHAFHDAMTLLAARSSHDYMLVTAIAVWMAHRPDAGSQDAARSILLRLIADCEPVREHHALAQLHLSNLLFAGCGKGIERDPPRALELLYHVHHMVKHPEVQALSHAMLGDVWVEGKAGWIDIDRAYGHYCQAAGLVPAFADRIYRTGVVLENGHPAKGACEFRAFQHFTMASSYGHVAAKVRLAARLCSAQLKQTRWEEGIRLYREAAGAGSTEAARALRALGVAGGA